jgi:large conductance mechanosensitive channel
VLGGVGGLNFNDYFIPLDGKFGVYQTLAEAKAKTAVLAYGSFVTIIIQFLIVAACVFALIKVVNRIKRTEPPPPAAPAPPSATETLLTEIRDLLKKDKV